MALIKSPLDPVSVNIPSSVDGLTPATGNSIDGHTVRLRYSRSEVEGLESNGEKYGSSEMGIAGPGDQYSGEEKGE